MKMKFVGGPLDGKELEMSQCPPVFHHQSKAGSGINYHSYELCDDGRYYHLHVNSEKDLKNLRRYEGE